MDFQSIVVELWFSGGAIAAFGVGMYYFLIPKMGVGPMMSYALAGQILLAVVASHFGWFDMPVKQIHFMKIVGIIALIVGIILVNIEK
jgi:transporter family-2 protein